MARLFSRECYNNYIKVIMGTENRFEKGQTIWTKFQIIETKPNESGFLCIKRLFKINSLYSSRRTLLKCKKLNKIITI